jgi:flagellar biosynthesis/type III secretory pathway protein FliH
LAAVFLDAVSAALATAPIAAAVVTLRVNPRSESKLRGMANANIGILRERFELDTVQVAADPTVGEQEVWVNAERITVTDDPLPAPSAPPQGTTALEVAR